MDIQYVMDSETAADKLLGDKNTDDNNNIDKNKDDASIHASKFQKMIHYLQSTEAFSDTTNAAKVTTESEGPSKSFKAQEKVLNESRGLLVLFQTYEQCCVFVLSRLLQILPLRPYLKDYLCNLPYVPQSCIKLLTLLMYTGSRPVMDKKQKFKQVVKNRGTRLESLLSLGHLFFANDLLAQRTASNTLLWGSVVADFEIRSKVINLLAKLVRIDFFLLMSVYVYRFLFIFRCLYYFNDALYDVIYIYICSIVKSIHKRIGISSVFIRSVCTVCC